MFDAYAPSYNKSMDELQYSVPKRVEEWSRQARASSSSTSASSCPSTSASAPVADDKVCAVHPSAVLAVPCNQGKIPLQNCTQSARTLRLNLQGKAPVIDSNESDVTPWAVVVRIIWIS